MKKIRILMLLTLSSSAFCGSVLNIYQKVQPILLKKTTLPVILPPSSVFKAVTGFKLWVCRSFNRRHDLSL